MTQPNYYNVCGSCTILCCKDANPPITSRRKKIIQKFLSPNGQKNVDYFETGAYTYPKPDKKGVCSFLDVPTKLCFIQPVKPETCVAGPVTFDINLKTKKIEWFVKESSSCPIVSTLFKDKRIFSKHFKIAKRKILTLVKNLTSSELNEILKVEEDNVIKLCEEELK